MRDRWQEEYMQAIKDVARMPLDRLEYLLKRKQLSEPQQQAYRDVFLAKSTMRCIKPDRGKIDSF